MPSASANCTAGAAVDQSMIRSAIKLQQQRADADCIGRVDQNTMGLILESDTSRSVITERARGSWRTGRCRWLG